MANDFYQLYRQDTSRLAETMVIKFDVSAVATNRYLQMLGIEVGPDRRTWRYYMNMAGLYHSTNRMMRVKSLDTDEIIDFTVANLEIHRATARGYAHGSKDYNDLVALNPKQESLILGILNPVDLETAVNAPEHSILWMDRTLIDSNEDNLQELLQKEIDGFLDRWHVEMYSSIDDLYDAGRIMVFYAYLVPLIFSVRLRNDRTHRAQNFFIRQYLARYGRLDRFMDAMTKEQQLMFYQNVIHFHKYPGWQDSFEWLVDAVLADRNLPLADHQLIHNESNMMTDLIPGVEFNRRELTRHYKGINDTKVTVPSVVQKQGRLATYNTKIEDLNISNTVSKMQLSRTNNLPTKVLESQVFDLQDSMSIKLEDLLISYWAYMGTQNTYFALTLFTDQRTGEEVQLNPKDAFILFLYSYNRAHRLAMPNVPTITANHILKKRIPTVQQLFDLTSKKFFTLKTARAIRDMIPEVRTIVSTESFYDTIYQVWQGALNQMTLASGRGHAFARGEIETMALAMFNDVGVDLADNTGQTMSQWLKSRGLELVEDYTEYEFDAVWSDLLSRATGVDLNTTMSLAYIHRAMIGIMERLSSYSVQYIREINEEPMKALTNKWIWPANSDGSSISESMVSRPSIIAQGSNGFARDQYEFPLNLPQMLEKISTARADNYWDIQLKWTGSGEKVRVTELDFSAIKIQPSPMRQARVITGEDYNSDFMIEPINSTRRPIAEVLLQRELSGLNLPTVAGLNIDKVLKVKGLSGINPPGAEAVPLGLVLGPQSLGGFTPSDNERWVGNALVNRELSGLNLPT